MTTPITFTDANGVEWTLCKWRKEPGGELRLHACEADLRAALPEGYALVRLTGEEASDDDLAAIEESAYTGEFGYAVEQRRALYLAGLAAGRAEREARERERVAKAAEALGYETDEKPPTFDAMLDSLCTHRQAWAEKDGNSPGYNLEKAKLYGKKAAEWKARAEAAEKLSEGLARGQDDLNKCLAEAESELTATKAKLASVSYRNKQLRRIARDFAADRSRAYAEASAAKEKLADAERERDVGYDALDVLMEREDRAKTELARERDDARAELAAARAKLAELEAENAGLPPAPAKPVCSTCCDTHRMTLHEGEDEREVMCTRCPVPCERCRSKPQGPYCAATPCPCECHTPNPSKSSNGSNSPEKPEGSIASKETKCLSCSAQSLLGTGAP